MQHLNRKTKAELIEYVMTLECHCDDARLAARLTLGELELAKRLHAEEIKMWKARTTGERIDTLEAVVFERDDRIDTLENDVRDRDDIISELRRERDEAKVFAASRDEHADALSTRVEELMEAIATLQHAFDELALPPEHIDEPINIFNLRRAVEDADVIAYRAQQSL